MSEYVFLYRGDEAGRSPERIQQSMQKWFFPNRTIQKTAQAALYMCAFVKRWILGIPDASILSHGRQAFEVCRLFLSTAKLWLIFLRPTFRSPHESGLYLIQQGG